MADEFLQTQIDNLRTTIALEAERRAQLDARVEKVEASLSHLNSSLNELMINVRVLEARMAIYAGAGAAIGGIVVAIIEAFLTRRLFP